MSFIKRIAGVFGIGEEKEKRGHTSALRRFLPNTESYSITSQAAIAINAVYVSARILGETFASYKFLTLRKDGDSRTPFEGPVSRAFGVYANPNLGISAFDFWQTVFLHIVTYGNFYARIERDGDSINLYPEMPFDVTPEVDDQIGLFYKIKGYNDVFLRDEILHFKTFSWDGIVGINPIQAQKNLMKLSLKQGKYAESVYGTKPPGYLSTDMELKPDVLKELSEFWNTQVGDMGGTPALGGGIKYHMIPLNPSDIQYIQSREITDKNIYAMFRIPPTMAQDYERATYSNAEQQDLILSKYTMLPYVRNFEQEIKNKLLTKGIDCKFNMNSILRADFKTRSEGLAYMWDRGIINDNDWRGLEDMNPKSEGGKYYVPLNFIEEGKDRDGNENL